MRGTRWRTPKMESVDATLSGGDHEGDNVPQVDDTPETAEHEADRDV
jgi:hypothetical protein